MPKSEPKTEEKPLQLAIELHHYLLKCLEDELAGNAAYSEEERERLFGAKESATGALIKLTQNFAKLLPLWQNVHTPEESVDTAPQPLTQADWEMLEAAVNERKKTVINP